MQLKISGICLGILLFMIYYVWQLCIKKYSDWRRRQIRSEVTPKKQGLKKRRTSIQRQQFHQKSHSQNEQPPQQQLNCIVNVSSARVCGLSGGENIYDARINNQRSDYYQVKSQHESCLSTCQRQVAKIHPEIQSKYDLEFSKFTAIHSWDDAEDFIHAICKDLLTVSARKESLKNKLAAQQLQHKQLQLQNERLKKILQEKQKIYTLQMKQEEESLRVRNEVTTKETSELNCLAKKKSKQKNTVLSGGYSDVNNTSDEKTSWRYLNDKTETQGCSSKWNALLNQLAIGKKMKHLIGTVEHTYEKTDQYTIKDKNPTSTKCRILKSSVCGHDHVCVQSVVCYAGSLKKTVFFWFFVLRKILWQTLL